MTTDITTDDIITSSTNKRKRKLSNNEDAIAQHIANVDETMHDIKNYFYNRTKESQITEIEDLKNKITNFKFIIESNILPENSQDLHDCKSKLAECTKKMVNILCSDEK